MPVAAGHRRGVVAAERIPRLLQAVPEAQVQGEPVVPPPGLNESQLLEQVRGMTALIQGWMECIGPTTSQGLAARLGLGEQDIYGALLQLEAEGQLLRGHFAGSQGLEWCDRRLLSRMHRMTIGRLRREIQSVPAADFIRFLLHWQRVQPGAQLEGVEGLLRVIWQLQGLELPAPAWEREVLPARLADYKPSDLEALCLSGQVVWGRLSPRGAPGLEEAQEAPPRGHEEGDTAEADSVPAIATAMPAQRRARRLAPPTRSAPIGFALREDLPGLLQPWDVRAATRGGLSSQAQSVLTYLERQGASFQEDIRRGTGLLAGQVEEALWELAASGLVSADGLADLRALLLSPRQRDQIRRRRSSGAGLAQVGPRGRWALFGREARSAEGDASARVEPFARQLLLRYGVVLRELLARESQAPPWRELLRVYRRMEARGEIRGGRFVDGRIGEQFALPEAVDTLRRVRRTADEVERVIVSAADPLNLVGILTPGSRVSPLSGLRVLYERGVPVQIGELAPLRRRSDQAAVPTL
jgi:ATP-dependent Lhr-like helicase